jgi:Zinc knuckle
VRECQRLSIDIEQFHRRFPPVLSNQRRRIPTDPVKAPGVVSFRRPGLLPAPKPSIEPFHPQPYTNKRDSITPGPRATPAPADPAKSTCFNCGETGHFANACPNPRSTPRINEIEQEDNETLGDNKATKEDETESEN